MICSAFLHVSKDPIAGVNQSACAYYKRMYDFFCENKPERSTRSQIGIKKGGNLSKRQLVSFLHSNRKLIGEMKVAKNEQDRVSTLIMHLCLLYKTWFACDLMTCFIFHHRSMML